MALPGGTGALDEVFSKLCSGSLAQVTCRETEMTRLTSFLVENATDFLLDEAGHISTHDALTEADLVADMKRCVETIGTADYIDVDVLNNWCIAMHPIHTRTLNAYMAKEKAAFYKAHNASFELSPDDDSKVRLRSSSAEGSASFTWEWEDKGNSRWVPYSLKETASIEAAFQAGQTHVDLNISSEKYASGTRYSIFWQHDGSCVQLNQVTGYKRKVRRRELQGTSGSAAPQTARTSSAIPKPLKRRPDRTVAECQIWHVNYDGLAALSVDVMEEHRAYATAKTHFTELTTPQTRSHSAFSQTFSSDSHQTRQPRIVRIELLHNATTQSNFDHVRLREDNGMRWVFHGTPTSNLDGIAQHGFQAGGQGNVPIANGAAYGRGVYTAVGPDTPMHYGHGQAVILALAKPGKVGKRESDDCDSWQPKGDWYIFRSGAQLLPAYILYFA